MINEGDRAPSFPLQADDGTVVTLDSLPGKKVVLFFYPKDNTSGLLWKWISDNVDFRVRSGGIL